jgi:hypothetical protein
MSLSWPHKDPDEVLDYQINWAPRLGTDTITTSTWIVPGEITQDSASKTDTATTIWLSGGAGNLSITNRIQTAGGRTMDQTVTLKIEEK